MSLAKPDCLQLPRTVVCSLLLVSVPSTICLEFYFVAWCISFYSAFLPTAIANIYWAVSFNLKTLVFIWRIKTLRYRWCGLFSVMFFFCIAGIESWALCLLGRHSTTKLHFQPQDTQDPTWKFWTTNTCIFSLSILRLFCSYPAYHSIPFQI